MISIQKTLWFEFSSLGYWTYWRSRGCWETGMMRKKNPPLISNGVGWSKLDTKEGERGISYQLNAPQCENLQIFLPLRFQVEQIWKFWALKNCHFDRFSSSEVRHFGIFFQHFQMWNFLKNQNSGPKKWPKLQFLSL